MGVREDAESISLRVMDGSVPMNVAVVIAWSVVMSRIIGELCKDDPAPYRYRLAVSVMERWGMVLPHTATPKDQPKLFVGDDIKDLRALFHEAAQTAMMVRIFNPFLELDDPARKANHDRDEAIIRTLRDFCEIRVAEVDRLSRESSELTCELGQFLALIGHLAQLMHVTLGDADMELFRAMYDDGMGALTQVRDLAEAPPQ